MRNLPSLSKRTRLEPIVLAKNLLLLATEFERIRGAVRWHFDKSIFLDFSHLISMCEPFFFS